MASVGFPRKTLKETLVDSGSLLLIVLFVLAVGGVFATVGMSVKARDFAVILGGFLVFLAAFASGNPRLYCFWGLILTIPLNLSKRFGPMFVGKPGGEDSFKLEVSDVFLIAMAGFLLIDIITQRRKGLRIPKVTFLWVLLIAVGCVWVVVGQWQMSAAHEVVRMIKVMILFLIIANELDRPSRIWHCAFGLLLVGIAESAIALAQYRMKGLLGLEILGETTNTAIDVMGSTSVQGQSVFRPSGLLQHPNLLGMYLALLLPLALGLLMVSKRPVSRIFFLLTLIVGAPTLIITLSRSSWVAATISVSLLLTLTLFRSRLRPRSLSVISLAGLLGVVILGAFFGPITDRLLRSKEDATTAREIWKADARSIIEAAPLFGHGLNSYSYVVRDYSTLRIETYASPLLIVHHIFYLWWAETGIVGLLLFCSVWGSIIWTALGNLSVRDEMLFVVNAACLSGMVALIPDGFLSFTLRVNQPLRMFWLEAGMIMAIRYLRLQEKANATLEPAHNG